MDPFTGCFVPDSTFALLKGFVDTFVHDLLIELENNTSGFHFRKNTKRIHNYISLSKFSSKWLHMMGTFLKDKESTIMITITG
jgi:hypothetical protein